MSNNEYERQEDPTYLQRREIEILEAIHERLKEIRDFNERQEDTQDSIKRMLSAINTNIFWFGLILVGVALFLIFT